MELDLQSLIKRVRGISGSLERLVEAINVVRSAGSGGINNSNGVTVSTVKQTRLGVLDLVVTDNIKGPGGSSEGIANGHAPVSITSVTSPGGSSPNNNSSSDSQQT